LLAGKLTAVKPPFAVLQVWFDWYAGTLPGRLKLSPLVQKVASAAEGGPVRYDITAVIRRKIVFKDRPKPLIAEESRGLSTCACCFVLHFAPPLTTSPCSGPGQVAGRHYL
jgi:hypothetical protein